MTGFKFTMFPDAYWGLNLEASDIAVYLAIAKHRNNKTGECYPSITEIAKMTRLNRTTVVRCVARLVEANVITKEYRSGKATRYIVPLDQSQISTAKPVANKYWSQKSTATSRKRVPLPVANEYSNYTHLTIPKELDHVPAQAGKSNKQPSDPRIKVLSEYFIDKQTDKYGEKPTVFAYAKAGRFFKIALKKHTEDEIKTRIDIFFSQPQKSYTFNYFQALYDELRQVKNNGRQPTIANSTRW